MAEPKMFRQVEEHVYDFSLGDEKKIFEQINGRTLSKVEDYAFTYGLKKALLITNQKSQSILINNFRKILTTTIHLPDRRVMAIELPVTSFEHPKFEVGEELILPRFFGFKSFPVYTNRVVHYYFSIRFPGHEYFLAVNETAIAFPGKLKILSIRPIDTSDTSDTSDVYFSTHVIECEYTRIMPEEIFVGFQSGYLDERRIELDQKLFLNLLDTISPTGWETAQTELNTVMNPTVVQFIVKKFYGSTEDTFDSCHKLSTFFTDRECPLYGMYLTPSWLALACNFILENRPYPFLALTRYAPQLTSQAHKKKYQEFKKPLAMNIEQIFYQNICNGKSLTLCIDFANLKTHVSGHENTYLRFPPEIDELQQSFDKFYSKCSRSQPIAIRFTVQFGKTVPYTGVTTLEFMPNHYRFRVEGFKAISTRIITAVASESIINYVNNHKIKEQSRKKIPLL